MKKYNIHIEKSSRVKSGEMDAKAPIQWVERLDASTGRPFWGHITTKETTWDEPQEIKTWREACDARGDVWVKAMDPKKKRPFYVHRETKESTWHRPGGRIITKEEHSAQKKSKQLEEKEKDKGEGESAESP